MWCTIINPAAGGGRCGARSALALASLREVGLRLEVHTTDRPGHATSLAREAYARGYRRFLAMGGDGTAFEVLNGLFPRPARHNDPLVLATLPLGTGNSFLRDFGIADADSVMSALVRERHRPCDVVRAVHSQGTIHFINLMSLAFSARAGALTNRRFKPLGPLGYILAVLSCVAGLTHPVITIRIDGGEADGRPCSLLSFSNSRYTGGTMMMAPRADPADGELDVIRVGAMGRLSFTATFPAIFAGTHVEHPQVEQSRARSITFEDAGRQDVMVDGEIMSLELRSLAVLPSALRIVA
jgi:YegS/Rv2252/BmrU family lipid kinase